jgi:hypothetical protein
MVAADQVCWPRLAIYTEWWSRYVVKRGIGIETFALEVSRCGEDLLSISVLGPVVWEDRSTGRCTDAGAGNLLDKYRA